MKNVTLTIPVKMSDILMYRIIGCVYGIYQEEFSEEFEGDIQHVIDVLKGLRPADESLKATIERLRAESSSVKDIQSIITDIVLKLFLRRLYQNGKILESESVPIEDLKDFVELVCSNWMMSDEFFAVEAVSRLDSLVDRAMELRETFIHDMPPKKVREYIAEATQCYVQGFYQACIITCRAVVEAVLERELRKHGWHISVIEDDRKGGVAITIINAAMNKGIIDRHLGKNAHSIRTHGNQCLHQRKIFSRYTALQCLKNTTDILRHIYVHREEKTQ